MTSLLFAVVIEGARACGRFNHLTIRKIPPQSTYLPTSHIRNLAKDVDESWRKTVAEELETTFAVPDDAKRSRLLQFLSEQNDGGAVLATQEGADGTAYNDLFLPQKRRTGFPGREVFPDRTQFLQAVAGAYTHSCHTLHFNGDDVEQRMRSAALQSSMLLLGAALQCCPSEQLFLLQPDSLSFAQHPFVHLEDCLV